MSEKKIGDVSGGRGQGRPEDVEGHSKPGTSTEINIEKNVSSVQQTPLDAPKAPTPPSSPEAPKRTAPAHNGTDVSIHISDNSEVNGMVFSGDSTGKEQGIRHTPGRETVVTVTTLPSNITSELETIASRLRRERDVTKVDIEDAFRKASGKSTYDHSDKLMFFATKEKLDAYNAEHPQDPRQRITLDSTIIRILSDSIPGNLATLPVSYRLAD